MNKELFLRAFGFTPLQISRMERLVEWQDLIQRLVEIVENQHRIIDTIREENRIYSDPSSRHPELESTFDKDYHAIFSYLKYLDDKYEQQRQEYLKNNPFTPMA